MQQRGVNTGMEIEPDEQIPQPPSRSRNNSKLKVLTRSHAMREETSPPRDPTTTPTALGSPCIKLSPSFDKRASPQRPLLVLLSPSASRGNSPSHTPNLSPTNTLVASPTRYSPQIHPNDNQSDYSDVDTSPKVSRLNRQNVERLNTRNLHKTDIIVEESSQVSRKKCECTTHTCQNCLRNQERNFNNNLSSSDNNNTLTVTVSRHMRGKLRQQSSSQGSFEGSSLNSPSLSRDNSSEQYTDTTGVDLELFIPETLNRNAKDRALMLRIEEELVHLAKDKIKTHFKFPPMSSYQRMLVHRCAAYFGMDHNIESSGKCVVVNKTKNTRIPDVEFKQHIKEDIIFSEEPRRSILKRDSNSIEDYNFKSPDRQYEMENRRSKSFEEREEEYEKVRRRIFNKEHRDCGSSADDLGWPEISWSSSDNEHLGRYRLHASDHLHGSRSGARLLKVQSEETGEETLRPCVAKSYSFGGYGGVLARGDSVLSTHSAGPRLLTKQDSAASSVSWRLSPSSSGYKTQSQRSESVTPSPTSTPYLSGDSARQDSTNSTTTNISDIHPDDTEQSTQVVWAVTNINRVPKGSVIINPQTGQPVKNNDGSVYHYDPDYPLPELQSNNQTAAKPPPSPTKSPQKVVKERPASPKRRSRGSPIKKTNSSTSPSLPFTPPPIHHVNRNFPSLAGGDNLSNMQPQQPQFPIYGPSYTPENNLPMYQPQPQCIVFAPYSSTLPVPYETRMENQVADVGGYYNLPETLSNPPSTMTYQPPQMWNQPAMAYYQNTQPPQRYSVPIPHQGAYITPYHPNYIPPQNIPPAPSVQNELLTVYPQQPLPMLYQQPQTNPVYPNQIYTQQSPHVYPQNISYPVNTPTPNSCTSSVSNGSYLGQVFEHSSIVQNMTQMTIAQNKSAPNDKKRVNCKGSSNQSSSTETSSPAMTVIAGYCHNQGLYRQTPDTPPTSTYGNNFVSPMFFRQMSNVRASPPVTSRSSRSPTPASDAHVERPRYPLPPLVYQGLPYPIQSDARLVPSKGQPTAYRTAPVRQSTVNQAADNKNFKNRRSRGSKASSLPPNGRPQ